MSNIKATEISVNYNLPDNWSNESAYSFDHLSDLVLQLHNSAYTAAVKAVNRFATGTQLCNWILHSGIRTERQRPCKIRRTTNQTPCKKGK